MIVAMRLLRAAAAIAVGIAMLAACSSPTNGRGSAPSASGSSASDAPAASGAPSTPVAQGAGARFLDADAVTAILAAARHDVEITTSYDYRHLDESLTAGLAVSTGGYRAQFRKTFESVVETQAQANQIVQTTSADQVGIGSVDGDEATVLAFGQIAIKKRDTGENKNPFAVVAGLRHVGDAWLIERLDVDGRLTGDAPGSPDLAAAVTAGQKGSADLVTYSRAHFDADFARALSETTGDLHAGLAAARKQTLASLMKGRFDLAATVFAVAVAAADGRTVRLLVSLDGYRVKGGTKGAPTRQHLAVTLTQTGGRWLLREVSHFGVS